MNAKKIPAFSRQAITGYPPPKKVSGTFVAATASCGHEVRVRTEAYTPEGLAKVRRQAERRSCGTCAESYAESEWLQQRIRDDYERDQDRRARDGWRGAL